MALPTCKPSPSTWQKHMSRSERMWKQSKKTIAGKLAVAAREVSSAPSFFLLFGCEEQLTWKLLRLHRLPKSLVPNLALQERLQFQNSVGMASLFWRWQTAGSGSIPRWCVSKSQDRWPTERQRARTKKILGRTTSWSPKSQCVYGPENEIAAVTP